MNPGTRVWRTLRLAPPALLGAAFSILLVVHAHQVNRGIDGFPLDDPWIHLTYARNLHDHHSFSYFPGAGASAGSTAPLYTLLLAAGFAVTRDEKLLSYVLGICFHAAFLGAAAAWGRSRLGHWAWGWALAVLLAFDPRIAMISVSGMETSLFLFLVALAFWARATRRWRLLGVALGLGVWTRPDALILAGVFVTEALLARLARPAAARRSVRGQVAPADEPGPSATTVATWAVPFAALLLLYAGFNLVTGGHLVPNTFAAKHAYYTYTPLHFLTHDMRDCFFGHGFLVLTPLALMAIGAELIRLVRRRASPFRAETGWALALPLAYLLLLPFAHRFSRYLVPALPAVAVLGLATLRDGVRGVARTGRTALSGSPGGIALALIVLAAWVLNLRALPRTLVEYPARCEYYYQRHERCGRWLREHTPANAVIATHDVGAIAFYSDRRIVDVVGLIQPDAVSHLHRPDYIEFLNGFFERQGVTHLAVLDSWLEVANQDRLWLADERPEQLSVYAWIPGRTVLVPEPVSKLNHDALDRVRKGDAAQAIRTLERSLELLPNDSRTWFLMGGALALEGQAAQAELAFRTAIRWFPENDEARLMLGAVLGRQGRTREAMAALDTLAARRPGFPGLAEMRDALGAAR